MSRRSVVERIVNEAYLWFYALEKHYDIALPDGYDIWAAGWARDVTVMWVRQKGRLRRIEFTNRENVEETIYEGDKEASAPIPANIREAVRAALDAPAAPKQVQEPLQPVRPASASEEADPES